MELFDDWKTQESMVMRPRRSKANVAPTISADAVGEQLADFEPPILNVHCYADVQYRWVQVVFEDTITPDVAIRLGERLARVAGKDNIYFNSLRPRAVYFLLEPPLEGEPEIRASNYGSRLAEIEASWNGAAESKTLRAGVRARAGAGAGAGARAGAKGGHGAAKRAAR